MNDNELIEKVKMGLIKIKNFNLEKPNELLCILTEETLSVIQKRMFDYFLWNAKQKILKENIKECDNFLKVQIPLDELITISGIQKTRQNKIAYLTNKLRQLKKVDIIKVNLIKEASPLIKNKNDLLNIKDEEIEEIVLTSPIGHFKINRIENSVLIYISPFIAEYLIHTNSYTQINFLVYYFLRSNYSIALYNYLLSKFQSQKALMQKGIVPFSPFITTEKIPLKKLMDILEIPPEAAIRKKTFWMLNAKILSKAIKELNNEPTVEFEIVELIKHTKGKRVTDVSFVLKEKENKKVAVLDRNKKEVIAIPYELYKDNISFISKETDSIEDIENKFSLSPLEELKEKLKTEKIKSLREFSNELQKLKNIDITNILPNAKGKILRVNEFGMLELDGEEVDNIKANAIRRILYQNPDLLGKFEKIDNELEELKDKFINKVWVFMQNGFYYAVGVKNIIRENQNTVKVIGEELLRKIKDFKITVAISYLKTESPRDKLSLTDEDEYIKYNTVKELEELEEFFEVNKDKFQEWLDYLEEKSLEVSNKLLSLDENTEEYKKTAKELEILDRCYTKGYELLNGESISNIDKKQVLERFKEWAK